MTRLTVEYQPAATQWFTFAAIQRLVGQRATIIDRARLGRNGDTGVLGEAPIVAAEPVTEGVADIIRGQARKFRLTFEMPDAIAEAVTDGQAMPKVDWTVLG